MPYPIAIAQCVVVALLAAAYIAMAVWAEKHPVVVDDFKEWRDAPEGIDTTTHTTLGKLL